MDGTPKYLPVFSFLDGGGAALSGVIRSNRFARFARIG